MKKLKLLTGIGVTLLVLLGLVLPVSAAIPVDPPFVHKEMKPGESVTVLKTVNVPPIPPKPDIYFLADTTGSMTPSINVVKANAAAIMAAVLALQPTAQFGVGNYKDFPYDPYAFQHQRSITSNTALVQAAINNWAAGGGSDGSEGWLYADTKVATDPIIGWRSGSTKILVQFGDAPGHDPVPAAAAGVVMTEATTTAALVGAGVKVIAVSLNTGGYAAGLDDNPTLSAGDYLAFYDAGYVANGLPGQATRIANATGGAYLFVPDPADVAKKILEGLTNLKTDVWPTVVADAGLSVTFVPDKYLAVQSGTTVTFTETIKIASTATCGVFKATVTFWANSYPKEGAVIGTEGIEVGDFTPPKVSSVETVNPAGKKIPPAGSTTLPGPKGGMNEDGFYVLTATDNCDPAPLIYVTYEGSSDPKLFGPFASGTVVKFTEAKGAEPSSKKMGSTSGQADAVDYHITLPADAEVRALDHAGNWSELDTQLVPPKPK